MTEEIDWKQIHAELAAAFPEDAVKWRTIDKKSGLQAAFIKSRNVQDRLDEVVGAENWSDDYETFGPVAVKCRLTIHGVTKTGIGCPNSDADEEPLKSAESDSLKRSAVKFGCGRYLYSLPLRYADGNEKTETPTGGKPGEATDKQLGKIRYMCQAAGSASPNLDGLTKAEASTLIEGLNAEGVNFEHPRLNGKAAEMSFDGGGVHNQDPSPTLTVAKEELKKAFSAYKAFHHVDDAAAWKAVFGEITVPENSAHWTVQHYTALTIWLRSNARAEPAQEPERMVMEV